MSGGLRTVGEASPEISVVMSVYNDARYVGDAIQSIRDQTHDDFELIVFDDGSTDGSGEIIDDHARRDRRVRPVRIPENRGYAGFIRNLNAGLDLAAGRYVARMDADDVAVPSRLERQKRFLDAHPEIFLVGSSVEIIDHAGASVRTVRAIADEDRLARRLARKNCIFHPTIMFRHAGVMRYREKIFYSEDYDAYLCLLSQGRRIRNLPDVLLRYRITESSVSFARRPWQALMTDKAREFYQQRRATGTDRYDEFDPRPVLETDPERSRDPVVLGAVLKRHFMLGEHARARAAARRYFRHHGWWNRYLVYYLAALGGGPWLTAAIRLVPLFVLRKLNE